MKTIEVRVIPNARKSGVERRGEKLVVRVSAPASGGKANRMLVEIIADYFSVKKGGVRILKGEKSRQKTVEIAEM